MEGIVLDNVTTAREFNSNLKRIFKEEFKLNVRVRIINSYKFPKCRTQVWTQGIIPNDLRLLAVKEVYGEDYTKEDNNPDINMGNIREKSLSVYAHQWDNILSKYLSEKHKVH